MMTSPFLIPAQNMIGAGSLKEAIASLKGKYERAFVVTDRNLNRLGLVHKVGNLLRDSGIEVTVFDQVKPNPTTAMMTDGLFMLRDRKCDLVVSLGGGSAHDCAKGIALCAANGGRIRDYEGTDKSAKPQIPLVTINTTIGTGSEISRFCIITDEELHKKVAVIDKHVLPIMSVNDPSMMMSMPRELTAASGMDALSHAIEAYISPMATPVTDTYAIKAIELLSRNLRRVVDNGTDFEAREQMAHGQFMAGLAFNHTAPGCAQSMAHQLGGLYDMPYSLCNAVMLAHLDEFHDDIDAEKLQDIAVAMGADVGGLMPEAGGEWAFSMIKNLSAYVGIPNGLKQLGLKDIDIPRLAQNAVDAYAMTYPWQPAAHAIEALLHVAA